MFLFFKCHGDHRDLHVLTHSFPTRRSADLTSAVLPAIRGQTEAAKLAARKTWKQSSAPLKSGASVPTAAPSFSSRSEEHTSELQSLMRISYAVFCLKKNTR